MKTDEKIFGEEHPNQYDIRYWNIEDSYLPGSMMDVDLTFHVDHDRMMIFGDRCISQTLGRGREVLTRNPQ